MDALQSVESDSQCVVCVVEVTDMQNENFAAVPTLALQIPSAANSNNNKKKTTIIPSYEYSRIN